MNDLQKIFISELSDVLDAEHQLIKALPEMAEAARSEKLRSAFRQHFEQTQVHVQRVENIFRSLAEQPQRHGCKAMEGLIDEGQLVISEFKDNAALDTVLICAAQKVEHYEIAAYGCLCTWAELLDFNDALSYLKDNLSEEKDTDELLSDLAIRHFNRDALVTDTEQHGELASTFHKVMTSGT